MRKNQILNRLKSLPENQMLFILAFIVGLASGIAAVLLKNAIHLVAWILKGWFNTPADSLLYILYPGIGILLAMLFVRYIIKDDIGHGVTKVLVALSKNKAKIKSHNMWSSVVASSVTIGFGGSVGAEAPIVYAGSAIGSNVGRFMGLSYRQITILLGCGAAGGLAGIFKAPLAGILFTLEILLFNISMTSILPLLVSVVTATVVSYFFMGNTVVFANSIQHFQISNIPYYIVLGVICGFVSLYFTRTTLYLEDKIKSITKPIRRWIFASISLGLLIFLFPPLYGEGYDVITNLMNNNIRGAIGTSIFDSLIKYPWVVVIFFIAVVFFKVFAMSLTNAGGGVGGTFGPTLFMGGVVGFVAVRVMNMADIAPLPEENFVLVGMAGLMAGVMQAPMTAIFLIAEITGGYVLLIPLIVTSAISFATIRSFEPYSIYTKRLAKQGSLLTHDSDKSVLILLKTEDLIEKNFLCVGIDDNLKDLIKVVAESNRNIFPVLDSDGRFCGMILLDDIRQIMFNTELYDKIQVVSLMKDPEEIVREDESMDEVMSKFERTSYWNLPVLDSQNRYLGFVSKSKIFSAYRDQLQEVSHE